MSITKNTISHESRSVRDVMGHNKGGRDAIKRLLQAYGFSSRQALCLHLNVSQSTMANRYARDTFPADWVILCNIETGASLIWLTAGLGSPFLESDESRTVIAEHKKITNGMIEGSGDFVLDKKSLPDDLKKPFVVSADRNTYLVDFYEGEIVDGVWLIKIDNLVSIRELVRFPGGKIRVDNGKVSYECRTEDITVLGKVITKTEYL